MDEKPGSESKARFLGVGMAVAVFLGVSLGPSALSAQDRPVLDRLVGNWEGSGELFGSDATFSMSWEPIWNGRFVRLTFQNNLQRDGEWRPVIQAEAFYQTTSDSSVVATWFDSRGMVLPITGRIDGNSLTSSWGTPETEEGRTIYRFSDNDTVDVEDYVKRGEAYQQFGRASYRRQ